MKQRGTAVSLRVESRQNERGGNCSNTDSATSQEEGREEKGEERAEEKIAIFPALGCLSLSTLWK